MKKLTYAFAVAFLLALAAACSGRSPISSVPSPSPTGAELPVCPPVNPGGTVAPAIAVCSVTYVVNGAEQVVRGGDALQASPGDTVQIGHIAICVGSFDGDGGQACVDFVPLDGEGGEITAGRMGTHQMKVTRGCQSIPGPEGAWTVGANWQSISAVLNHWPPGRTEDLACADGLCERDDRLTANLR